MKKKLLIAIALVFAYSFGSQAQSTVISTPSPPSAAGSLIATQATITFVVQNTNTYPMILTDLSFYRDAATSGWTYNLWYNATSLSGVPGNINTPAWTQVATTTATVVTALGVYPLFTGLSFTIPANTTYRFALQASGGTMNYGTAGTTSNTNSGAGVNLLRGDAQIAGQAVGYSGNQTGPTTTPRFFVGSITVKPAIYPCAAVSRAGTVITSDTALCAGRGYDYMVFNNSHSVNDKDTNGYTWYWESSIDNVIWHLVPGSVNKDTLTGVFTGKIWYRMYMICTTGPDTVMTNTVHINELRSEKCYCYSRAAGAGDSSDIGAVYIHRFSADAGGTHLLNSVAVHRRSDYTGLSPIELYIDSTYKLEIKHIMKGAFHKNAKVTVFMDFNNNQQYDLPHEKVFTGFTDVTNFVLSPLITIPDSAIQLFPTGMRIILNDDTGPNAASDSACGGYISGETEDFMVLFQRAFPVGLGAVQNVDHLSVYPNPSTGRFFVEFDAKGPARSAVVTVTDMAGRQLLQHRYADVKGKFRQELDLGRLAKGVYFLQLGINDDKINRKITID